MIKLLAQTTTALTLGLGLMLTGAPAAMAQNSEPAQRVESTQGSHIETRARGRVGHVHGGGRRHYSGNRGRYIAGGVATGIAGAIILNEAARSSRRGYYYSEGSGLSCGQLEARCDAGQDWACRRLDRDPSC